MNDFGERVGRTSPRLQAERKLQSAQGPRRGFGSAHAEGRRLRSASPIGHASMFLQDRVPAARLGFASAVLDAGNVRAGSREATDRTGAAGSAVTGVHHGLQLERAEQVPSSSVDSTPQHRFPPIPNPANTEHFLKLPDRNSGCSSTHLRCPGNRRRHNSPARCQSRTRRSHRMILAMRRSQTTIVKD